MKVSASSSGARAASSAAGSSCAVALAGSAASTALQSTACLYSPCQPARGAQRVALEVVGLVGDHAGLIEVQVELAAQVAQLGFRVLLAVDQPLGQQFLVRVGGVGAGDEGAQRAAQRVVFGAEGMAAAVPGADGLAGHVVQHPALARLHAGLVDAVAEHVVVVAHDDAALRVAGLLDGVAHCALVAFDVQLDAGGELLDRRSASLRSNPLCARVRKGRPSVSKWAIGGRVGVGGGLLGGGLLLRAERAARCAAACQVCQVGGLRLAVLGDSSPRCRRRCADRRSRCRSATVSFTSQVVCRHGSNTTFS